MRAVVAESVLAKHQLLILNRSRQRAPNLRALNTSTRFCADRYRPHFNHTIVRQRGHADWCRRQRQCCCLNDIGRHCDGDGGLADNSASLIEAAGGRVHTLFNTCWFPEQTGSNLSLGKAGVTIMSHENTRLWMTTDIARPWESRTFAYGPKTEIMRLPVVVIQHSSESTTNLHRSSLSAVDSAAISSRL